MTTQQTARFFFLFLLTVSLIPLVQAMEPAWIYSMNNEEIGNIAVSSDGSTIVAAAGRLFIFSKDGSLIKKELYGDNVVLTPDGKNAAASFGGTLYYFRTPLVTQSSGQILEKIWDYPFSEPIRSIDITDDGSIIAVATRGQGIHVFTTVDKVLYSDAAFYNAIFKISHDRRRIVGISADKIRLYRNNAKVSTSYNLESAAQPEFMFLSPTIPLMIYNDGSTINAVDVGLGTELWNVQVSGNLESLAMTPAGSFIVAGTETGDINIYDGSGNLNWFYSSSRQKTLTGAISAVALSKDGTVVAAGSSEGSVFIFDGRVLKSYQAKEAIRHIAVSNDGSIVIAADQKNIYAFSTGPSLRSTSTPVSYNRTTLTTTPARTGITELPTTYSVIRTPTQGPVSSLAALLGILGAALVILKRR